ncbi:MAG: cytochrome c [Candidatus Sulfotelmatobacter sp.]
MGKWPLVLLSFVLGMIALPAVVYLYFLVGQPPVAVADNPFPFEAAIVRAPLHARIDREMPKQSPLSMTDDNLVAGMQIYREQCASCHGLKLPSKFGPTMFPRAPQLWERHKNKPDVVGVSDDPVGETYWKVRNGIRLSGMPSYKTLLTEEQLWQVAMVLSVADKPLPTAAVKILVTPLP